MKRKAKIFGILFLAMTACLAIAGCEKGADLPKATIRLETPENVKLTDEVLEWSAVENATGYIVELNGEEIETKENKCDLFERLDKYGLHEIRVQAKSEEDGVKESDWSKTILYKLTTPEFVYTPINGGAEYEIGLPMEAGYNSPDRAYRSKLTGKIIIPSVAKDGKAVTAIAKDGFSFTENVTGIMVPESVRIIQESGFNSCDKVKRLAGLGGVTTIGKMGFAGCNSLTEIDLPETLTSIGQEAFHACLSLTKIGLPESLTSIGQEAFKACTSLTKIEIPKNVESVGLQLFNECTALKSVSVAKENVMLRSEENCIIRRGSEELIEASAAERIPDGVRIIGEYAFGGNKKTFEKLIVPKSVKTVRARAFNGLWEYGDFCKIKTIVFSEGVEEIGEERNEEKGEHQNILYSKTESVTIPSTVKYIAPGLVSRCALSELKISEWNPIYKIEGNCIIRKDNGEIVSGCNIAVIPEATTRIGDFAFFMASQDEIRIPDRVQSIGAHAFSGAFNGKGNTELKIPDSVTEIGKYAFQGNRITFAEIPEGITEIVEGLFRGCTILKEVKLPSALKRIGKLAFYDCENLNISIPESVSEIEERAFHMGDANDDPRIPDSEKAHVSVTLPKSVTFIGPRAFWGAGITIYTSASTDVPFGWHQRTVDLLEIEDPEDDDHWASYLCNIYYECGFEAENGSNYVHRFVYSYDDGYTNSTRSGGDADDRMPYREGYTFIGWSVEINVSAEEFEEKRKANKAESGRYTDYLKPEDFQRKVASVFIKDKAYYTIWEKKEEGNN